MAGRKKKVLSIATKLEIISKREKGETVGKLAHTYDIGKQTVRDIIKKKDDLLKFVSSSDCFSGTSSRKSMKRSKLEELDTAVYKWFQQQRAEGNPISGPLLCEKAVWFHKQMQLEEPFSASQGWLSRFKARHGIRQLEIHGEKLSASKDAAELFKSEFLRIVRRHDLSGSQIYNANETGLFWKALPTKTLAYGSEKSAPGYKMSKERITLMACANASGDHKLKLVCIGRSKKTRSFKGSNMKIFPVAYYSQKKAWMNQDIFKKWFVDEFEPKVRAYLQSKNLPQKAVLFLDNAPSHPDATKLSSTDGQIFVEHLPPNVTSLLQPMDQGVLASLKRHYRKILLRSILEDDGNLKDFYKKWSIKSAIEASANSWENESTVTFQRSWCKLYPLDEENTVGPDTPDVSENHTLPASSFLNVMKNVDAFKNVDESNVEEWLACDAQQLGYEIQDDDSIIEEVLTEVVCDAQNVSDLDDEQTVSKISPSEALHCTDQLLQFLEPEDDTNYADIVAIRKIRTQIRTKMCKKTSQLLITDFFKS